MRITDLPIYIHTELYKTVVINYLEQESNSIEAIYTLGNVSYPGLSDVDLIVIPKPGYFVALNLEIRNLIPDCYKSIIHHNPFILPLEKTEVFRFTSFSNLQLYYGVDHLKSVKIDESRDSKLSIAIEGLISYVNILDGIEKNKCINARYCVPIFSSFRFTLEILCELGVINENDYNTKFDSQREELVEKRLDETVLDMYTLFKLELKNVIEILSVDMNINISASSGIEVFNGVVNEKYYIKRHKMIQEYMDYLNKCNYSYGSIFRTELFNWQTTSIKYRLLRKLFILKSRILD